jgi:hypothetical protein
MGNSYKIPKDIDNVKSDKSQEPEILIVYCGA